MQDLLARPVVIEADLGETLFHDQHVAANAERFLVVLAHIVVFVVDVPLGDSVHMLVQAFRTETTFLMQLQQIIKVQHLHILGHLVVQIHRNGAHLRFFPVCFHFSLLRRSVTVLHTGESHALYLEHLS